jgi:RNA polymerase sigma factor (sigma-70 family)
MVNGQFGEVLRHIRSLTGPCSLAPMTDGELLRHFVGRRDEAAFSALVERHGPMVLGVCRRVLGHAQDVDDAFQATFLVLVQRANSITHEDSVGSWLYGVAHRICVRVKTNTRKRQIRERPITDTPRTLDEPEGARELRPMLDEVLRGLPEKYRAPVVLHYLSGRTIAETARDLGWTEGTVSGRLARARGLLRTRLTRRGVALAAGLAAWGLSRDEAPAAVPTALRDATLAGAMRFAGTGTSSAAHLAEEVLRSLVRAKVKATATLVVVLGVLVGSAALIATRGPASPSFPGPGTAAERPTSDRGAVAPRRQAGPGTDGLGDPLPAGAVARLGTTRGRHARQLTSLALSPDGKLLVTRAGDDRVRLWEAASGKELHALGGAPASPGLWGFAFAPDGRTVVTAGADGWLRFWDPATGRQQHQAEGNPHGVRCVAFSGDGKLLAVGGEDNAVDLWDTTGRKRLRRLGQVGGPATPRQAVLAPLNDVVFCPGDRTLAVLYIPHNAARHSFLRCLELLDVESGRSLRKIGVPLHSPGCPALSADGKGVFWISAAGKVTLRAVSTGEVIRSFDDGAAAQRLALSPDGRALAVASWQSIRLWEAATGTKGRVLQDSGQTTSLAFSRDGRTLAAGGYDGTFQLWSTATGEKLLKPLAGHEGPVLGVASSPDGKTLATCCPGGTIRLWQASTGKEIRRWRAPSDRDGTGGPTSLACSPDGKTLAAAGWDRTVRLWDAATGKEVGGFSGPPGKRSWQSHVQFSPDGKLLATRDVDGAIRLWTSAGQEKRTLQKASPAPWEDSGVRALAFSPSGRLLAGSQGPVVRVWEVATGAEVRRLTGPAQPVTALAFSRDGKSLASAGEGDVLSLWEVATGRERRRLTGQGSPAIRLNAEGYRHPDRHAARFNALIFAPDGQTLLGGRADGGIYVWDLTAHRPARKVCGHREEITCLAVCGDGKTVASASVDRTVLVWDIAALKHAAADRDR